MIAAYARDLSLLLVLALSWPASTGVRFHRSAADTLDRDVVVGARALGSVAAGAATSAVSVFTVPIVPPATATYRVADTADGLERQPDHLPRITPGIPDARRAVRVSAPCGAACDVSSGLDLDDLSSRTWILGDLTAGRSAPPSRRRGTRRRHPRLRSVHRCDNHAPMGGRPGTPEVSVAERLLYNPRGS